MFLFESSSLVDPSLKSMYRKLTIRFHPDNKKTGDNSLMAEMNAAAEKGDYYFKQFLNKLSEKGIIEKTSKEKDNSASRGEQYTKKGRKDYNGWTDNSEDIFEKYKKKKDFDEKYESAKEKAKEDTKSKEEDFKKRYDKVKEEAEKEKAKPDKEKNKMNELLLVSLIGQFAKRFASSFSDKNVVMEAKIMYEKTKPILVIVVKKNKMLLKKEDKIYKIDNIIEKFVANGIVNYEEIGKYVAAVKIKFVRGI